MQPPKKGINILQLPIVELSNKPRTLTTPIPNTYRPSILRGSDSIKASECIPQRQIPTPPIFPEFHLIP